MMKQYIINENGEIVEEPDFLKYAQWFSKDEKRRVDVTFINDSIRVSTVFIGLCTGSSGKPLFFETMIFGGPLDQEMSRTSTVEEARLCHKRVTELAIELEKFEQIKEIFND